MEAETELELAWAAGFFEGEGCTRLIVRMRRPTSKTPQRLLTVTISQVDREVLDRFTTAVGIGRVGGPYSTSPTAKSYKPNARPWYQYAARGGQAEAVLAHLWPWLGRVKREQAMAAGYVTHNP